MLSMPFLRSAADNPVLIHELRARMRGARAYWVLLAYLVIVAAALAAAAIQVSTRRYQGSGDSFIGSGPLLFGVVTSAQAILIALIAPALTCGAITLERERGTYEMLAATQVNTASLVFGKLAASLSFLLLCLAASMPAVFVTAAFGGLSPGQILSAYGLLALEAAVFGALGLFWSSVVRSTITATVLAYPSAILACLVTLPFGVCALEVTQAERVNHSTMGLGVLGSLSPFVAGWVGDYGVPFFHCRLPFWLPALIIGPLVTALLCALSMERFKLFTPCKRRTTLFLAGALLLALTLTLSGGLLSPEETMDHPAVVLWGSLLLFLAAAIPFVVVPEDCKASPPLGLIRNSLRGWGIAALWMVLTSGMAVAAMEYAAHTALKGNTNPGYLALRPGFLLALSFLLAETGFSLFVARWTCNRLAAILAPLITAGCVTLLPLLTVNSTAWEWLYLSPIPALDAIGNHGFPYDILPSAVRSAAGKIKIAPSAYLNLPFSQPWHITATEFYLAAAGLFLLLALIPRLRRARVISNQ